MNREELMSSTCFMTALFIALLMCFAGLFTSCGSQKSATKQEASIESGSGYQRKDTASLSEQVKKTEAEDVTEETEEVTTVYDTSKPTDPSTGKPPVHSETKKSTKKESNKNKTADSTTTMNQSSAEQSRDTTSIKDQKAEDRQKIETTVPKQIGGMFWALATLVGLVIVGWLLFKKRKK